MHAILHHIEANLFSSKIITIILLGSLCIYSRHAWADSVNSTTSPSYLSGCITCNTKIVGQENYTKECTSECPKQYYQGKLPESFECSISITTPPTTVELTTTTASTATSTAATTLTVPAASTNTNGSSNGAGLSNASSRKRRLAEEGNFTDDTTTATQATTVPPTTEVTTTIIPTTVPKVICKLCFIVSCSICEDNSQNETICANCATGYHPSKDKKLCVPDEEDKSLSGGAIAGIVIGVLCFVAIVAVVAIFVARRYCRSSDFNSRQAPSVPSGGKERNISSPLPKNNTENVHRQRDRNSGYRKGPTQENNIEQEQYEINQFPPAPDPPIKNESKRYDKLQPEHKDEQQSYSSMEDIDNNEVYVNIASLTKAHNPNEYANSKPENRFKPPPPSKPAEKPNQTAEEDESYEPINFQPKNLEPQETYSNEEHIAATQRNKASAVQSNKANAAQNNKTNAVQSNKANAAQNNKTNGAQSKPYVPQRNKPYASDNQDVYMNEEQNTEEVYEN